MPDRFDYDVFVGTKRKRKPFRERDEGSLIVFLYPDYDCVGHFLLIAPIISYRFSIQLVGRHKFVMTFFDNAQFVVL